MRRPAAAVAAVLLLAGCASGPTQPARVAAVRQTWTVTASLAGDIPPRVQDTVIATHPDLTITGGELVPSHSGWDPCHDELYDDHWDGPDESYWIYNVGYDIEPRQATIDLIEPLLQSYLADGWTLSRDFRADDSAAGVNLVKDDWTLLVRAASQHWVDTVPDHNLSYLDVSVLSPCAPSPRHMTEWDPERPHDFSFVTQDTPQPTW